MRLLNDVIGTWGPGVYDYKALPIAGATVYENYTSGSSYSYGMVVYLHTLKNSSDGYSIQIPFRKNSVRPHLLIPN
jgi:hypothetical protein